MSITMAVSAWWVMRRFDVSLASLDHLEGSAGAGDITAGRTRWCVVGAQAPTPGITLSSAAPHGVIVGLDGAAWITEGGQNAIARVDPATRAVTLFPLPKERRSANLNTVTFDHRGMLWFTGRTASMAGSIPNQAR